MYIIRFRSLQVFISWFYLLIAKPLNRFRKVCDFHVSSKHMFKVMSVCIGNSESINCNRLEMENTKCHAHIKHYWANPSNTLFYGLYYKHISNIISSFFSFMYIKRFSQILFFRICFIYTCTQVYQNCSRRSICKLKFNIPEFMQTESYMSSFLVCITREMH